MGWRSWNCFHGEVNDSAIRATIDAITDRSRTVDGKPTSLADLGFDSVGIDDGWQACGTGYQGSFHDEAGTPLVNKTKFPSLKDLVTYGHSKGVKMGWYTGNCICGEGGVENSNWTWANLTFVGDAKFSIEAGFDGMKIDNCAGGAGKGFELRMRTINASGKPVLVENSNQAHGIGPPRGQPFDPEGWCGANFFRADGDISPDFNSIIGRLTDLLQYLLRPKYVKFKLKVVAGFCRGPFNGAKRYSNDPPISRPGCWAYPDMMEVGNLVGMGGPNHNISIGLNESRSHFGAWVTVSSPLIIGMDITNKTKLDSVWPFLSNPEAIAVNQAWDGEPGKLVWSGDQPYYDVVVKRVNSKWEFHAPTTYKRVRPTVAVLVVNKDAGELSVELPLSLFGLPVDCTWEMTYKVRDIWGRRDLGEIKVGAGDNSTVTWAVEKVPSHDSVFLLFEYTHDQQQKQHTD